MVSRGLSQAKHAVKLMGMVAFIGQNALDLLFAFSCYMQNYSNGIVM